MIDDGPWGRGHNAEAAQLEREADAGTSLSDRIRQWDDWVEDEDEDQEEARRPFDAGIMLAVAKVLERWDEEHPVITKAGEVEEAIKELRDTVEAVLDGSGAFPEDDPSEESGPSEEVQA